MNIPKKIKIGCYTLTINFEENLLSKSDVVARLNFNELNIIIQTSKANKTEILHRQRVEQAFFHEIVHFILYSMNYEKYTDEAFVDVLASNIYDIFLQLEMHQQ